MLILPFVQLHYDNQASKKLGSSLSKLKSQICAIITKRAITPLNVVAAAAVKGIINHFIDINGQKCA